MNSQIQKIKEALEPIFNKYSVKKATLFGSVAKNAATEKSDVDILVDSGLKGIAFYGLLEDVVDRLKQKIDLIDASQIESGSRIEQEIKDSGVIIYG